MSFGQQWIVQITDLLTGAYLTVTTNIQLESCLTATNLIPTVVLSAGNSLSTQIFTIQSE